MGDKISPWQPITDKLWLKRLGKLSEELGECNAIVARTIIQGLHAEDPDTAVRNRDNLCDEMADVLAQLQCTLQLLNESPRGAAFAERIQRKMAGMSQWEGQEYRYLELRAPPPPPTPIPPDPSDAEGGLGGIDAQGNYVE